MLLGKLVERGTHLIQGVTGRRATGGRITRQARGPHRSWQLWGRLGSGKRSGLGLQQNSPTVAYYPIHFGDFGDKGYSQSSMGDAHQRPVEEEEEKEG